jgi:hypothetical protein
MAQAAQNKKMGVEDGGRDTASIEQFQAALNAGPDIVDELTALLRVKLRQTKEGKEGAET